MGQPDRQQAFALLNEYTQSASLLSHARCVEQAMKWYGRKFNLNDADLERWSIAGLLHDFDYEKYPNPTPPEGHPFKGNEILKELGYDDEIRDAIMGHAEYTGVARISQMAKTLFAVDELSGLVVASTLVRPDKSLHTLDSTSVMKKFKDKAFARGCNRDDIRRGAEEIGIELKEHMDNVILALREIADELGLGVQK